MGYDPIGLRPATVEELAAQERRAVPRHRRINRRPTLIFLATCMLLVIGAGAYALARADSTATVVQPYGPDAPFGVGFVDGFGEHSPKPSVRPSSQKPRPASPASPASPRPSAVGTGSSRGPSASTGGQVETLVSQVSAVTWTRVDDGRYDTYVWVHNEGSVLAAWEVRVVLPQGATLTGATAVSRTFVDGTWVFKPSRGDLGAGLVYLFGFSGTTGSSRFSLGSCTVNGSPCDPFR